MYLCYFLTNGYLQHNSKVSIVLFIIMYISKFFEQKKRGVCSQSANVEDSERPCKETSKNTNAATSFDDLSEET